MTMLTALEVADYVRDRAAVPDYDTIKLQKLVYFAQAWHIAWLGRPLFDEAFEAWPKGPVVRSVFREQTYGRVSGREQVSGEAALVIDSVLAFYGGHDYNALVELSHDDEPWNEAREGLAADEPSRKRLDVSTLRDFYVHRAIEPGDDKPKRPACPSFASDDEVARLADLAIDRWAGALAILAKQ